MPRLQLNIRMDNEEELFNAIKAKAERLNTTVTDVTIAALKNSLGWQIPADAIAMLNKINANESEIRKLKKELEALKEKRDQPKAGTSRSQVASFTKEMWDNNLSSSTDTSESCPIQKVMNQP